MQIGCPFDALSALAPYVRVGSDTEDVWAGSIEQGFSEEEVNRVRTQLRSGSLMQMEHGPARARQLAVDQFRLGRPRSLEDMLAEFENLDADIVNEVCQRRMNDDWRARATRSIVGPAT